MEYFIKSEPSKGLIFDVVIGGVKKEVRLLQRTYDITMYESIGHLVYVEIPAAGDYTRNKLRPARLYGKRINGKYRVLNVYEVLRSKAFISSWIDDKNLCGEVATDYRYPDVIGWDQEHEENFWGMHDRLKNRGSNV